MGRLFCRLTAAALILVFLLTGCSGDSGTPSKTSSGNVIAYVPLDDRPDNVERVEYLAESLGYTVKMPDTDLYATRLDGQPRNSNGTQYGDRGALYEWVLSQEKNGCHRYILSLDQLLSGGLVNSRHMAGDSPIVLSNGSTLTGKQLLENLLSTLASDPDNQVWLLDSVMRLAPTVGYAGFGLNEYNALRAYGMEARQELSGGALTVESIVKHYTLGTGGSLIACRSDSPLPADAVKNYLASRERKLRLSDEVEQILSGAGYENDHLLIGIDDSSTEDSVQKNEIAYLRQGLRTGDALLSGVDDLGFKAVTKLYLTDSGWTGTSAQIRYYGGTENEPACDYDYMPLTEIMAEHLDFFDLTESSNSPAAGIQILVLTQPKDADQKETYAQSLIDQLNENEKNRAPTILIDASNGTYGTDFHDALVKQCNLGWLLSYSGFLDMAIVTGTAISHGVARYARLQNGGGGDEAFQKTLAESIFLDFCYKNTVRDDLITYVRNELGGNADNFYQPEIDGNAVLSRLESGMSESTQKVLRNFSHSNLIVSLQPYQLRGCGAMTLSDYSFPWERVFEVRMKLDVEKITTPHRKILWFYT
jgi:hypothetical protein